MTGAEQEERCFRKTYIVSLLDPENVPKIRRRVQAMPKDAILWSPRFMSLEGDCQLYEGAVGREGCHSKDQYGDRRLQGENKK